MKYRILSLAVVALTCVWIALQAHAQAPLATLNGCGNATPSTTKIKPINNGGTSTSLLLVTGAPSQNVHICSIAMIVGGTAVNVAVVEGTTVSTACDTGTAGLMGGATAALGFNFAANGGLTYGNGDSLIGLTATAGDNVCLLFSAGVQVSGVLTYAVY